MQIFIISPNTDTLFTNDQLQTLRGSGDLTLIKDIKPFDQITELYAGDEPRIVAIDPDFSEWSFPNEVIDKIPNLRAICLQTTYYGWVDIAHAKQKGITVTNLRGFSSIAVAEWATFMTLAVARRVPVIMKDGWHVDYNKHRGFELRGKTAGIVGLGRIGTAIAENMAGLGMNVQYWSRHSEDARFTKIALDELVKTSDVILPAVEKSPETKGLIPDAMLSTMMPTAVMVSIAEPIYSHELAIELAQSGKIAGYAYETEKEPFTVQYDGNVWNGPALGWCTNESLSKNAEQWVEAVVGAVKGEYPTQVN